MNEIIIATKNPGKAKEFKALFDQYNIRVKTLLDVETSIPDVEETATTFDGNALLKAEEIATRLNTVVLADDSGLVVDALNGAPGVYSARYAGEPKSDESNNNKLLRELGDTYNRDARFVCVLALAVPGKETLFAKGTCEGRISSSLSGKAGFGYDPLFIPKGYDITMAELGEAEKNKISHRYQALQHMESVLLEQGIIAP